MFNHMVEHRSRRLDLTYGALSHPARREMLARLRNRDMRVTELAAHFDMSLAAASKHIGNLEQAGMVTRRIAGRDHWLSIKAEPMQDAAAWLSLYRSFWSRRLDKLEELLTDE
jgi:DNA-binding transcriptional ArsR family regulator